MLLLSKIGKQIKDSFQNWWTIHLPLVKSQPQPKTVQKIFNSYEIFTKPHPKTNASAMDINYSLYAAPADN